MSQNLASIVPYAIILRVAAQQFGDVLKGFWCILVLINLVTKLVPL